MGQSPVTNYWSWLDYNITASSTANSINFTFACGAKIYLVGAKINVIITNIQSSTINMITFR